MNMAVAEGMSLLRHATRYGHLQALLSKRRKPYLKMKPARATAIYRHFFRRKESRT